jgi:hypothetical protein
MLDTPSMEADEELANHVTYVHMHNEHPQPDANGFVLSPHEMRQYIARARSFRPNVPKSVSEYMVGAYVRMRQQQKRDEGGKKHFTHTSPRTLLGVLRLSQALARLRFSEQVVTEDVDEALRLIEVSKSSLYNDQRGQGDQTPSSKIYNLIRGMMDSGAAAVGDGSRGELNMSRVSELVIAKGFTRDQFIHCIDEYALLDVSYRTQDRACRLLTISRRFGKLPTTAPDLYSLRQVTRKILWTWVMRTTLSRDKSSPQASEKICIHARNHRMTKAKLKTKSVDVCVREICLDELKERGVLDFGKTTEGSHCRTCSTFPEYECNGVFSQPASVRCADHFNNMPFEIPASIRKVLLIRVGDLGYGKIISRSHYLSEPVERIISR